MERYVVDITDDALADMDALYEHIAKKLQAPENAMGQYNRIADAILTLESFPTVMVCLSANPSIRWEYIKW